MRLRLKNLFSFIIIGWMILFPAFRAPAQFLGYRLENDRKKIQIPFEIYNNLIVIPVKLNGIIPLNFVIDTGVRSSIITDKIITDILRLPYSRKIVVNGPGDYIKLEAYVVNKVDINMDGVIGTNQSLLVLEKDYLKLRNYLGTEVHGLVGFDLFNRFVIEIDYAQKVITFYEPKYFKPPKRFTSIPLSIEDTKPYIDGIVSYGDSIRFAGKFLIDTGASHALMLNETSSEDIFTPPLNLETEIGRGLGGPIYGKIAVIDKFNLDDYTFNNVVASFPDPKSYPDTVGLVYRNGTIGGEMLSRFSIIFDYFDKKIYLRKNHNYRKEFGYNMSGLTIIATGDDLNSFKVADVREGSPADLAGIQKGDSILYVNGLSTEKITLNDTYKLFNYRDGKKINLYIKRGDMYEKKAFRLKDVLDSEK